MLSNRINKYALAAALLLMGASASAEAQTGEKAAIISLLSSYEAALNTSSTAAVMPLYAEDGVFMPPNNQPAVGAAAVRQAYDAVFNAIKLNLKFTVAEVVQVAPDWAFARTNSVGTVSVNPAGTKSAEANQELFILKKAADGAWKIARYSFSTTNPPPRQQ
jgi:uncharacterized protein (TIGR02246 family)